jgi:uncharacterized protein (TIGR03032 family)
VSTPPPLEIVASPRLPAWLREQRLSVAFTTYQSGKLFLIGVQPDGALAVAERTFEHGMGLCATPDAQTLWMTTRYQLWRLENALPAGETAHGCDRLYVPQCGYTTGDLDAHDVALDAAQRPVFVATLFSCLAAPSESHSLRPLWRPPFVTQFAAEDRCHLNGLAMRDGQPAFVTAVSTTDTREGWRAHRRDGGVIVAVPSGEIVARGFSMPHSPRLHGGRLFVLNSGAGEFGVVDPASGKFEPICFCPGYARGLAISGDFAVIGLSTCREQRTFTGLPLDDALAARQAEPRCGLQVVDLRTGETVHTLTLTGVVRELYDVALLPGVQRPGALGFKTDEIHRTITLAADAGLELAP